MESIGILYVKEKLTKMLINREQCATMLFRSINDIHSQRDYSVDDVKDFPDRKYISSWAKVLCQLLGQGKCKIRELG